MPDGASPVDGETLERLYAKLWLTRRFEEVVAEIYPTDKIKSPVHLSIGQESIAVGVCDALRADDIVSGTYRGHATYLAKGGDPKSMMAELFGKDGGCARGKGGSMHLVDMGTGVLGSSAVVGSTVPVAMGYAFALKREGKGRVVAAFFALGVLNAPTPFEIASVPVMATHPSANPRRTRNTRANPTGTPIDA